MIRRFAVAVFGMCCLFLVACGGNPRPQPDPTQKEQAPSAPKPSPCTAGLAPLNAKITQKGEGSFTADLSSDQGAVFGVPIKVDAGYTVSKEVITQCVLMEFARVVVQRPELFDIHIDGQGKFDISSKPMK